METNIKKPTAQEKAKATVDAMEKESDAILSKGNKMTSSDRMKLLLVFLNVAYHSGGSKIAGCFSIDSTAFCGFCQKMIKNAVTNLLIICGFCYAYAESKWKYCAVVRHRINAKILSSILFTEDELKQIQIPGTLCRINEDGDIINETHARNILRIIKTHPETSFGFWYKNATDVKKALKAEGYTRREQLPKNVKFIHSSILIGFPAIPEWFDDKIFTVYPDESITMEAVKAGSVECNGKRCENCKFSCYRDPRQETPVHVAETLRTNKARRAEILKAYYAKKAEEARKAS